MCGGAGGGEVREMKNDKYRMVARDEKTKALRINGASLRHQDGRGGATEFHQT